jgi:hypothetical protein
MKSEERKSSVREKDEAAIELLKQLTRKLCSNDITTARLAAFNLSWMQEDGLAILTQVLLGVLEQGLKHRDRTTKAACVKALSLIKGGAAKKGGSNEKSGSDGPNIR